MEAKLDTSTDTKAILRHGNASDSLLSVSDGSKWIKEKTNALVTTQTGNKVMKQVLEMFQIKMEGPDVNQKKIYRGGKKKSNQRRPRVAWFLWQICSFLKAADVIYDDKFIAARGGENRAQNQRFDSLIIRLFICLIGRPVKGGVTLSALFKEWHWPE